MLKKHSTIVFKLFCAKNGSQKHLIFEKFELCVFRAVFCTEQIRNGCRVFFEKFEQ